MRSDDWDKAERIPFNGMEKKDPKHHEHHFDLFTGICAICLKSREQLRKEWR